MNDLVNFPKFVLGNLLGLVQATITDWETFALIVGAALIAYGTGEYYIVGGALFVVYALLRTASILISQSIERLHEANSLLGRVVRDNPDLLMTTKIIQAPELLVRQVPTDDTSIYNVPRERV